MHKANETVLEIDLKALEHNYHYLRSRLLSKTKLMAVVKAFAYGSDSVRIAKKMESLGVDYLAVAYVHEGAQLRKEGIGIPIMVLHPQVINFHELIEHHLEPNIHSFRTLKKFLKASKWYKQTKYPVHIKFNTGLNRLGFEERDIDAIAKYSRENNTLKIISFFSHLAASEDLNEADFARKQINAFEKIAEKMKTNLGHSLIKHLLNTSGILNYPEAQYDMVRSGIGLFGFDNEASVDKELKPVATLKTVISQIHTIEPNETVGYNRAFKSNQQKITATLPVGHADGIGRHYGNGKAYVSVHGKKAPIIGNVCMDMMMIDITHINCKEGDEVTIFGKDPTAEAFASMANTISYELLTAISQRVKRVFIEV
ncbi:Alanine racemase [hydrothermal vent metagenome]|uniref:Alanine racemase n=1 Tax=hydrothermal vent metagenome TaxID=652676 RepID=A0A3B0TS98_9ZZZZ